MARRGPSAGERGSRPGSCRTGRAASTARQSRPAATGRPECRGRPSQGVEPWGEESVFGDGSITGSSLVFRQPSIVVGDRVYVAIGQKLYRSVLLNAATWSNWTVVADLGVGIGIVDLVYYQGNVLLLCGNSRDIALYNTSTFAISTPFPGLKSRTGVAYGGCLVCGDSVAGSEHTMKIAGGALLANVVAIDLDAPIVRIALFGAKVAVATRTGLWLLAGRPVPAKADDPAIAGDQSTPARWSTDPEPFVTSGLYVADEDHKFLLSHGGRLYTWLANEVLEFNPSSQKDGWRAVGLEGKTCHGATVAGGRLIVTLTTRQSDTETWAWDGSGWWLLLRAAEGSAATRCWPFNLAGAGNKDLLLFRDASTAYDLYRLVWRSPTLHNYRRSASFRTSLLDAGERDKTKAWRKIGATFAAPETRGNAASADQVVLTLSYSLDGGATYTQAAQQTVTLAQGRVLELDAALAANAASSRWLQLKIDWSSVVDWAPVLTSTWAEYELLDAPARRRRWAFKIHARDATIDRAGTKHPRPGRQLAADLWTAWHNGATVPFKDLDHDADPTTRQVRIVGIAEEVPKPADAARWGDSVLSLTLVEV